MYIIPERKAPPTTVFNLYSKPKEKVPKNLRKLTYGNRNGKNLKVKSS